MKKSYLKTCLLLLFFSFCQTLVVHAQNAPAASGYWVTESNLKNPKYTLIRYYSRQHQLIKEEEIKGKRVNIKRPKTVAFLNSRLTDAVNKTMIADNLKATPSPRR